MFNQRSPEISQHFCVIILVSFLYFFQTNVGDIAATCFKSTCTCRRNFSQNQSKLDNSDKERKERKKNIRIEICLFCYLLRFNCTSWQKSNRQGTHSVTASSILLHGPVLFYAELIIPVIYHFVANSLNENFLMQNPKQLSHCLFIATCKKSQCGPSSSS